MKIIGSLSVFALILVSFSACVKTNNSAVPVNPGVQYVSASTTGSFAGTFYAYDSTLKAIKDLSGTHPVTKIMATSTAGTLVGSSLSIVIFDYPVDTGKYLFDSVNTTASYHHFPDGGGVAINGRGGMDISSVSPYITGTYTFTCTDLTMVTGSFNVIAP